MGLMDKILGDLNAREVKKLTVIADKVMALDSQMTALSDAELKGKTEEFKKRIAAGETLDDLLVEAFAVCREAAWRAVGMKPFKVQVIGGIALHQGRIAEMKTGEGKTLVATLPTYLNALEGKGVHVITVNDYLAKRDAEWMGKIYSFLGLTVGCVIHGISDETRKAAYQADITYGTNNEFGFDYLRDNMVTYKEQLTQRGLNFAIIDEVDSILIDEARTPLIISGRGDKSTDLYQTADRFVKGLRNEEDFTIEEKEKRVSLTEAGIEKAEKYFGIENFGDPENMEINHHVLEALKARNIMKRDVDYIVKDGEIVIVDEFTGRLMFGRRYNGGLHQAIEAKEGVFVRSESKTLATITLQNYFRMYNKLAGMTGTAKTEEEEFRDIYNMDVVVIPTNKPIARVDKDDAVYGNEAAKFHAIVDRIVEAHATGQPVLVGTISIENSERISLMLKKRGVKHNVLNAKQHEKEAAIVAEAGRLGAVTIATNMAGRGTDIILGGNPEFEAKKEMAEKGFTEEQISFATSFVTSEDPELNRAREVFHQLLEKYKEERKEEQQKVVALGGLCIIGTERHESRRIDNQLRGRSGRQGDPGETQFFISLEDDLMRLFGGDRIQNVMDKFGMQDEAIAAGMLSKTIENAQKKVEGRNFEIRKYVLQYDNVMNKQREVIYDERRKVLFGEDLKENIMSMMETLVDNIVKPVTVESKFPEEWNLAALSEDLKRITPTFPGISYTEEQVHDLTEESLLEDVKTAFRRLYDRKEAEIGADRMREVERMILLRVVDNRWMDHIQAMDDLKDGIGLRALGHVDPAAAYSKEGFDMFEEMIGDIQQDTVRYCYNVTVNTRTERRSVIGRGEGHKADFQGDTAMTGRRTSSSNSGMPDGAGGQMPGAAPKPEEPHKQETVRRQSPKVGRNDPCPCGSGKKYKNCCMKKDLEKEQ
ncbi:MAG: preprotein translocase subunit SecA [Firmicutes bacterium]|nr:preprotein translocase subunit SecA [Bacillota bacterium]MDY5856859.1 preprotein translocase subunit SecA [Anaerovoracaceae bacterium]